MLKTENKSTVGEWLPGHEGLGTGNDENVPELEGGDGCTIL